MSNVAAAAFAPFISAAGAGMFGFESWTELAKPRDLAKIFETPGIHQVAQLPRQRGLRASSPWSCRASLARLPYGAATKPIDEFDYEEAPYDAGRRRQADGARRVLLDERRLCDGHAADRRLRADTASAPRSAAPRAAARWRTCRPTSSPRDDGDLRRQVPDRDRHHRPARVRAVQPRLPAAVPLQEHRLRGVLRRADRRRSRRSTTGRRRPPTPRSRPACPTSWRPAASPTT